MKYPYETFKREVSEQLACAITAVYGIEADVKLEEPKGMADVAYPCFSLSKQVGESPLKIAETLAKRVEGKWIARVEAVRGYVNVFVNTDMLAAQLLPQIQEMGDSFGSQEEKHKTVIVEHTSANPNGPLHVGRARNPIIGDTLARLLRFGGYRVTTQYYVDDMGKQVAILYWGATHLDMELPEHEKEDHRYVGFYQKAASLMETDESVQREIDEIVKRAERGDRTLLNEIRSIYGKVLEGMVESLKQLNITIDEFVEESRFIFDGSTERVIRELEKSEYTGRDGNALYLDMEPFGVHGRDKRFYITRNDGTSLYATRDVAYHVWKGEQADMLINVLGEDHKLEAKFVEVALRLLHKKVPETIFYSFVSLPEGKMSTRKARVVYLDDLIHEARERALAEVLKRRERDDKIEHIAHHVAMGAIRYNIIKVRAEKPIVFKWEEALNFEGQSAPFIQYAHARCCSILRKAARTPSQVDPHAEYGHESEGELVKTLARFPDVVGEGVRNRNPSAVAEYAHELASCFNAFYRDCKVLGSPDEEKRLVLVAATRQVLRNSLHILGIEALEEM